MCLACTCVRYKALSSPLNGADAVSQLWWTRCWPSCITALDYLFRRPPQTCRPLSLAQRLVKTQQTPLGARVRPTRVLNWCNDGEREQFPFLPTSWWRCSEGPGGRQFIMCPSPLALSLGGTGRHMCAWITNPPTYPALPSPPSLPHWHRGERTWGIRVCKSIEVHIHFVHQGLKVLRCAWDESRRQTTA